MIELVRHIISSTNISLLKNYDSNLWVTDWIQIIVNFIKLIIKTMNKSD